jgi:hypothetical protein
MIVPEPCGYAVLLFITIIQENCALRPDEKKLHAPVHAPPSGLLATTLACPRSSPGNDKENRGGRGEKRRGRTEKELGRRKGSRSNSVRRVFALAR